MLVSELRKACEEQRSVMLVARGEKSPFSGIPGAPRGELLCVNAEGNSVWSFDSAKVLRLLDKAVNLLKLVK